MKVGPKKMVAMDYTLRLGSGEVVDSSEGRPPLEFIFGTGDLIAGLERELEGLEEGEEREVVVSPKDGYGERDPAMVTAVPADRFPEEFELEVGMTLYARGPDGRSLPFRIVGIEEGLVTIDFNHPLAGEHLYFTITVRSVRDATPEELLLRGLPQA